MRHTFLGNPLIQPWRHLERVTDDFEMRQYLFESYYICRGSKPRSVAPEPARAAEQALVPAE
jgi:hypothetical protein